MRLSILIENQGQTRCSPSISPTKSPSSPAARKGIGAATAKLLEKAGARVEVLDVERVATSPTKSRSRTAFARIGAHRHPGEQRRPRGAQDRASRCRSEDWDAVLDLNLTALFLCSRLAHPYMKKRGGGAIVNLASIMGLSGGIYPNASYQASKGGVVNLTRALALEWAADNIRVNAVAPTYVRTDLTTPIFSNPELLKTVMAHTPLGRLPETDDIAAAILFLCSDAARCITGVTLPVDSRLPRALAPHDQSAAGEVGDRRRSSRRRGPKRRTRRRRRAAPASAAA